MSYPKPAPVDADDPRVHAIFAVDPEIKLSAASVCRVLAALDESEYERLPDVAGKTVELDGMPGAPITWGAMEDTRIIVGRNGAGSIVAIELPDNTIIRA